MKDRHPSAAGSLDDASADEGGFSRHDETGPRDPRFRFSLQLPARWRPLGRCGEAPTGRNPIACLARYAPVDEPGAEVVVTIGVVDFRWCGHRRAGGGLPQPPPPFGVCRRHQRPTVGTALAQVGQPRRHLVAQRR